MCANFVFFERRKCLFLMFSREPKKGQNSPLLAIYQTTCWFWDKLAFWVVLSDEQNDLDFFSATIGNGEPPLRIFVGVFFWIKAKCLMSIFHIRSFSICGVVVDFGLIPTLMQLVCSLTIEYCWKNRKKSEISAII